MDGEKLLKEYHYNTNGTIASVMIDKSVLESHSAYVTTQYSYDRFRRVTEMLTSSETEENSFEQILYHYDKNDNITYKHEIIHYP